LKKKISFEEPEKEQKLVKDDTSKVQKNPKIRIFLVLGGADAIFSDYSDFKGKMHLSLAECSLTNIYYEEKQR